MLYVFLNIFCYIVIYVLFKLAKRYHIDVLQAVTWSFSANIFLAWFIYKPHLPANIFTTLLNYNYLALGILLPVMLMLLKSAIQATGITLTVISERLSLFVPVIASIFIYGNALNSAQWVAIALGLVALLCSIPWKKARGTKRSTNAWIYLLIVFFGMGAINILLDKTSQLSTPYPTSLFIIYVLAFVVSMVFVVIQIYRKKTKFSIPHILIGWVLGAASFGAMAFYIQAQKELSTRPSFVFTAMHIGIITGGTLVGLLFFEEKISKMNKVAIFFALIAIIVIAKADVIA